MKKVTLEFANDTSNLKKYKEELYARIVKSQYYNEFLAHGFSDEDIKNNLTKFIEYIDDAEISKKIKTYEDCKVFNKFDRIMLKKDNGYIEKEYVALEPFTKFIKYSNAFFIRDLDDEYMNSVYIKNLRDVKIYIKESFLSNSWIYLYGALRSGRTYAASSIVNKKYLEKENSVAFLNSPKRMKELCDLYFRSREDFEELMKVYSEIDCLVIDDFGQEQKNKILRDNILYVILSKRFAENKMTIFTSDFSLEEICTLYSKLKDDNNDIMAKRFAELLKSKIKKGQVTSNLSIY
ncbi:MAG: ATP-binding protein [Bacilli bacterium]|nr:ATP-binding protein [Bacilli bacterium]